MAANDLVEAMCRCHRFRMMLVRSADYPSSWSLNHLCLKWFMAWEAVECLFRLITLGRGRGDGQVLLYFGISVRFGKAVVTSFFRWRLSLRDLVCRCIRVMRGELEGDGLAGNLNGCWRGASLRGLLSIRVETIKGLYSRCNDSSFFASR